MDPLESWRLGTSWDKDGGGGGDSWSDIFSFRICITCVSRLIVVLSSEGGGSVVRRPRPSRKGVWDLVLFVFVCFLFCCPLMISRGCFWAERARDLR